MNEYGIIMASSENDDIGRSLAFLDHGGCWHDNTGTNLEDVVSAYSQGQYKRMNYDQCVDAYSEELATGRGLLILLVDYNNTQPTDRIFYNGIEFPHDWTDDRSDWLRQNQHYITKIAQ